MKYIVVIVCMLLLTACDKTGQVAHQHVPAEKYTCPMHPQVVRDAPGKCPVCGMDLVKQSTSASANDLMLSESQRLLANITTEPVSHRPVGQTLVVNGRLTLNQERSEVVSSRVAGRVEKLFIKETGRTVRKGEPLYTLYSEALLALQREYLLAREQFETLGSEVPRYASIVKAAEQKLLRYGLSPQQVEQLAGRENFRESVTFYAPVGGQVTEIAAAEGQYVAEGAALYRIDNTSTLWVEAELYPQETSLVKPGDRVAIHVAGFDNEPVEATVSFLSPEYRANTLITIMRAAIANPRGTLAAGMQAQVYVTHGERTALAVPSDAVIRSGGGAHVYVQKGHNTFRPVAVTTGTDNFRQTEITQGLHEGDTVVASGAYLLYSELVLKKGVDPGIAHQH